MENFNITIREIEFKYDASDIALTTFEAFAESMAPKERIEVSSWDVYFSQKKSPNPDLPEFIRLRLGSRPELTTKQKTDDKNNNSRVEIDVPLNPNKTDKELSALVGAHVGVFGFEENFRVYKYCSIYFYEKFDIVYYIVYNQEMKEQGRFIEIEALKEYPFTSEEEALACVKEVEQKMSAIGISPQKRTKKSMWERFKKG